MGVPGFDSKKGALGDHRTTGEQVELAMAA